ncbi:Threonine aldolase [Podila epigama]|nr:Threonine aldolase [Podila epigama]
MTPTTSVNPLPYYDFRSDTATAPTPEMFAAMMKSSLGDDVYNEDDSVKKLERYVATLCGHEGALFCASGTMTNQLAHRVHLNNPPQSAMVDIRSHVFNYEAGGISFHSQAAVYPVMPSNGKYLTAEDVASRLVLDVDVHYAPTRVISLENTLNGTIMPIEEIVRIRALTKEHGIKLHLDGARLWHASIATGISMKEYCSHFDSISLCLSKGIGAPIGSILVGSEYVIKKARHFRLLFGGGWRQAGILAEAALWGIKNNWPTMEDTHRRAKWLERVLVQVGCQIINPVDTNMIWVDTTEAGFTVDDLIVELAKEGIKISGSGCAARLVLHYQITDEAVERFIQVLRKMAASPKMKISVDLTRAAMLDNPGSVFDVNPETPGATSSMPMPYAETPSSKSASLSSSPSSMLDSPLTEMDATLPGPGKTTKGGAIYDEQEVSRRHNEMGVPNMKRCLFEESRDVPADEPEPVQPVPRQQQHQRGADSNGRTERPRSAYEPGATKSKVREAELAALKEAHREYAVMVENDRPVLRTTKSLDLAEHEARMLAGQLDRPQTADKKKVSKLQYRLAHNPASKAFKRASVRLVRLGTLLNRES